MKTLYYHGTIITLEDSLYASGVLVEEGKIKEVYYEQVPLDLEDTKYIDLQGKTLMPSFIDSHSHIVQVATVLDMVDLSHCQNFEDLVTTLSSKLTVDKECLIAFGYDHNQFQEEKHPNRELLDMVSTNVPILVTHKSGHMGVGNSKFLELAEITDEKENPAGGLIGRDENGDLTGYLEEAAFMEATSHLPEVSFETLCSSFQKAEDWYLAHGITTAQDGKTGKKDFELLTSLAKRQRLRLDIVSYIDMKTNSELLVEHPEYKEYQHHYRIGGYKLFLDGSPQGKTAWLSQPYENEATYCGYPVYTDLELEDYLKKVLADQSQVLVHCNGDAACEQLIRICSKLDSISKYRPVMIHAQLVRQDQLKRMVQLGIIPSFFVDHVYYWGDVHLKNLGDRAYSISPCHSASILGLPFTLHQDTPVLPPDMFHSIWCSVKRETSSGVTLGKEEQISVLDALKAVTIHAAYSYFEEKEKGSILPSKYADFIILDKNPLEVDIDEILTIQILETIIRGKTVFLKV
ncbi:MAG TPA: amidohydrolase [Candidatus Scybalousia intestinigallinarum]|nr:amidohydrolase [Candidatus Scybalousia intestinigallinarum]